LRVVCDDAIAADVAADAAAGASTASRVHLTIALNYVWPIRASEQVYDMRNSAVKNPANEVCSVRRYDLLIA